MNACSNHEPRPRRTPWRAWAACGLALLATAGFGNPQPQAGRVQDAPGGWAVEDARPVAAALGLLEQRTNWVFTYEDPPIVFADDMVDVTALFPRRDGRRDFHPRGGRLDIAGDLHRLVAGGDPLPGVQAILAADAALTGRAGRFRVTRTDDVVQVVGIQTRDLAGEWVAVRPVLDVPITWPERVDILSNFIVFFCDLVSQASGARVRPGTIPRGRGPEVTIGAAANEPARNVLLRMLRSLGSRERTWTWHLYYNPGQQLYTLSIVGPGVSAPKEGLGAPPGR